MVGLLINLRPIRTKVFMTRQDMACILIPQLHMHNHRDKAAQFQIPVLA
jgi:hypothetical protein